MTAYIDQDYVDARIGASLRASLVAYLGNTITLTDLIADASDEVLGGIKAQGYQEPDAADPPAMVKKFTFATVMDELYGLAGAEMPATYLRVLGKYQMFLDGKLQIVGLSLANNAQEIGGTKSTDAVSADGYPPKFRDLGKYL